MPQTQALIGDAGRQLPERVRLDPALLPLAGHGPDRASTPTTRRDRQHPALGRLRSFNDKNDLPVWLQTAGYRTIHIGKMPNGFGDSPTRTTSRRDGVPSPAAPGPLKGEFYGFLGPPSAYTDFTLDENGVDAAVHARRLPDRRLRRHGRRPDQQPPHALPRQPLYMQVQFFAPARSRPRRRRSTRAPSPPRRCRSTRASTRRTSRTSRGWIRGSSAWAPA